MKLSEIHSAPYRTVNFDGDLHVIPMDDLFEHLYDVNCPCLPFQDPKNKAEVKSGEARSAVFVHRQIKYNKESLT